MKKIKKLISNNFYHRILRVIEYLFHTFSRSLFQTRLYRFHSWNRTTYIRAGVCGSNILFIIITFCIPAQAHHVLGRPSYSLNENSTTPPSMQVETQIGDYFITYMVFPAFPSPNEPGRVNLYASRIDDGNPYQGEVTFKVRDDSLFNDREEVLGVQPPDNNVFRQGFEFREAGNYIVRAEFESGGEPYQIDFPLQIGEPAPLGPIGMAVAAILFILITVNLLQRKHLTNAKIRSAHQSNTS